MSFETYLRDNTGKQARDCKDEYVRSEVQRKVGEGGGKGARGPV